MNNAWQRWSLFNPRIKHNIIRNLPNFRNFRNISWVAVRTVLLLDEFSLSWMACRKEYRVAQPSFLSPRNSLRETKQPSKLSGLRPTDKWEKLIVIIVGVKYYGRSLI
jgi:hypothetical protein